MPIDTAKVTDRRTLHFGSFADLERDLAQVEAAHKAGTLRTTGNWTAGQNLVHLAAWMEYAFTGTPLNPPFFIRWFLRFQKKRFLEGPMRLGVRIPGVQGGTLGTEDAPFDEALARYRRACERLERECPTMPNVIFGTLTHDEWKKMHLRHAEAHLGFLQLR